MRSAVALAVTVALLVGACGGDGSPGDRRAEQARAAALDAGLSDEVADFLALAARGATATYQATYPGADDGTTLVVANRPPDRRVDVLRGDDVVEVRLVVEGEALECLPDERSGHIESCTRTDALVEPPGLFRREALERLAESLADRRDDFEFRVVDERVAGADARCLLTVRKEGRRRSDLGRRGEICVSPDGVLLRVEQAGEVLEATEYTTEIPAGTFVRPDAEAEPPE